MAVHDVDARGRTASRSVSTIDVVPLSTTERGARASAVTFIDVTADTAAARRAAAHANSELETAYEELQSTNEELETTNEELQSTVEELETTNEELQSTNEELETMNEELQSTNEELHAINDELRERTDELNHANAFLHSVLYPACAPPWWWWIPTHLAVEVWSRHAEDLWGLRADETTGIVLTSLDIGLPMDDIRPLIGHAFVDPENPGEAVIEAVNRRGRSTRIRLLCTAFQASPSGSVNGALLLMEAQS